MDGVGHSEVLAVLLLATTNGRPLQVFVVDSSGRVIHISIGEACHENTLYGQLMPTRGMAVFTVCCASAVNHGYPILLRTGSRSHL